MQVKKADWDRLNQKLKNLKEAPSKTDIKEIVSVLVTKKDLERYKRDWTWNRVLGEVLDSRSRKGARYRDLVAKRMVKEAVKGNMYAAKIIMDRMDGMPQVDITSKGKMIGQGEGMTTAELDAEIEKMEKQIANRLVPEIPAETEEGEVVDMEPIVQK